MSIISAFVVPYDGWFTKISTLCAENILVDNVVPKTVKNFFDLLFGRVLTDRDNALAKKVRMRLKPPYFEAGVCHWK